MVCFILSVQSQETLLDHCRLAGITCLALVSDKEGYYVKVNQAYTTVEKFSFIFSPIQKSTNI